MAKAMIQRWPIDHEQRKQVIERLVVVMTDSRASNREVIAAAKGLIAAEPIE